MRNIAAYSLVVATLALALIAGCPTSGNANDNSNSNANSNSNGNSNSSKLDPEIVVPGTYVGVASCDNTSIFDGDTTKSDTNAAVTIILDSKNNVNINGVSWTVGATINGAEGVTFKVTGITTTSNSILIHFSSTLSTATATGAGSGTHLLSWLNARTVSYREIYDAQSQVQVQEQSQGGTVTPVTVIKNQSDSVDCSATVTR